MPRKIIKSLLFLLLTFSILPVFAEIIVLKSGEKINAGIIEKNDKYVKVDFKGALIVYRTFEIKSIDGKDIEEEKTTSTQESSKLPSESAAIPSKIIETNIITAEEYLRRGIAFYSKGEFNHAISNLNNAIKIDPSYIEAYLYRGLAYAGKNNPEQAIVDYTKAIEINPKHEESYFVRGVAYAAKRDTDKAIADYSKAIEINPKYVQVYLNRALLYIMSGNSEKAIPDANKIIEINSSFAGGYYLRGLAYANKNNLEQAIADYTKAIEVNPQYAEAYANRGLARAYSIIEKTKIDPNSPAAYVNIGIAYLDKTTFKLAVSDCDKALEISPQYVDAYIIRAKIYMLANDFDNAWANIHKAESLGGTIKPELLEELKKASGREN